ncbi:hypothetical protein LX32DRAFT_698499 [Colletotrichum zoysiae]|uniref:Uncharacterized protein n=1 Tax=Colletotrichum zoysiae TaxID=1216348 RepID=A0AAD9H5E3_9PEZI|nr:hypothetical protein LX32DRAFT_698499 [Colletotrichum zoysiae]
MATGFIHDGFLARLLDTQNHQERILDRPGHPPLPGIPQERRTKKDGGSRADPPPPSSMRPGVEGTELV